MFSAVQSHAINASFDDLSASLRGSFARMSQLGRAVSQPITTTYQLFGQVMPKSLTVKVSPQISSVKFDGNNEKTQSCTHDERRNWLSARHADGCITK